MDVEPWQVVTSSQAAAHAMAENLPPGSEVFMIGEEGLQIPLEEKGFAVLSTRGCPASAGCCDGSGPQRQL